jgi:hypothetical protein
LEPRVEPGFVAPLAFDAGPGTYAVATGDFTGNGILDLVTANQNGNNVSVLLGNGDGTFQTAKTYAAGKSPHAVTVGDFTNKGILDVAVANSAATILAFCWATGTALSRLRRTTCRPAPV